MDRPVAGEPITSSSLTSTSTSTSTSPTLSASTKAVKETVSTSTATASRSTISESIVKQQQHYNHGVTQSSKNPCSDIQPATPTSIPLTVLSPEGAMAVEKARIVDPSIQNVVNQFQQSLKALNVQDYALPIEFRSLSKEVSHSGKKGFIPGSIRRSIRTLWEDFLVISSDTTGARTSLTAMDYRHFLMAMRYSGKAKESSKMITEMEEILRRAEVPLTRSMAGIVARAHLLQGSVQEAVRVYGEYAQTTNKRSIEHDRMLSVMVDGFVTSQRFSEGTMFLDWVLDTHQDPIFIQELYKRLFSHQLRTKSVLDSYSPKVHGAIRFFNNMTFPPTAPGLVKTLEIIEQDPNCVQLLSSFSQSVAGRLMKMRDRKLMTPLILSLLKANELNEVSRVLRLMQCQGMSPELDQVRVRVLRSMMKLRNTAESESGSATEAEMIARVVEQEGILDQWDWIVQQQGVLGYDTSEKSSIPGFKIDEAGHLAAPQEYGYSQVIAQCLVKEKDVETALQAAQYMRTRGWTARGIDFWKMNSAIVNFVDSSQYGDYLELRYTLGDPAAPDLHTYRRLIYAACRQSDLRSALTLYGQLKARHEDWKLDNTVYNAMISTASAMGLVAVAEKTFQCMIEDGVQPDYYSFHGLLNGYCNQKDLEAAILVPGQMVKWKLEPNVETFNLIIKAYLSIEKPNISTSRRLLKTMQASKTSVPPNLLTFNMLLDGYRRAGNTGWFDHFFDRYFAPPSDPVPESESNSKPMHEIGQESFLNPGGNVDELDAGVHTSSTFSSLDPAHQEQTRAHPQTRQAKTMEARRSETRPGRGNDQTLLVQLKYSLSLPDVDLETVWELWNAIQAKFQKMESPKFKTVYLKPPTFKNRSLTDAEDGSAQGFGTSTMGLKTDKTTGSGSESGQVNESSKSRSLPRTHVPFKRMLGSTLVQATDEEQFQFMVLKVFRDAFEDRGDNRGVNKMEKMQRYIFGSHPDVIQREADRVKSRTMQSGSSSLKSVVKGQGNKGRVGIKKGVKQGGKGFMNGSADSGSWEGH
ncbi:serine/threonine kinase [Lunasporangiospora selenospora]|uniref:Serine/threonine kinase n=1 Tax=Lunasporangiospora selenospora TaxID=979761 RepID=A0A9P6G232_9FUNG|nr:serine/threonine kinase [Lunasporangiospora selenospora]